MKNFAFSALGGVLALIVFALGSVFGEFINVMKNNDQSSSKLEINEQIEYTIISKPDLYVSNPSFYAKNLSDEDKSVINARFSGILTLIKESGICEGGSYNTFNERAQDGTYSLSLASNLSCKFSESELGKYNELIANIENLIKNSPVKLHLSAINPVFSEEASAQNDKALRSGIIKTSNERASELSAELGKSCELKELGFGGHAMYRLAMSADTNQIQAPEQKEQKLRMSANAIYNCK